MARFLKGRPTIGFFINQMDHKFNVPVWSGIADYAEEKDVNLLIINGKMFNQTIFHEYQENVIYNIVKPEMFDGVIFATGLIYNLIGEKLYLEYIDRFKDIPRVSLSVALPGIPSAIIDNKSGMKDMVNHLLDTHGYRKIAFLKGPDLNVEAINRLDAYKEALNEHDIPIDEQLILPGSFIRESGVEAVVNLFDDRKIKCEAIAAANDNMALGVIQGLKKRGLNVPDDIAITGFDDHDEVKYNIPPLSTVYQPVYELSAKALLMILDQIEGKSVPELLNLPAKVQIRESCGCLGISSEENREKSAPIQIESEQESAQITDKLLVKGFIRGLELTSEKQKTYLPKISNLIESLQIDTKEMKMNGAFLKHLNKLLTQSVLIENESLKWEKAIKWLRDKIIKKDCSMSEKEYLFRLMEYSLSLFNDILQRKTGFSVSESYYLNISLRGFKTDMSNINHMTDLLNIVQTNLINLNINTFFISLFQKPVIKKSEISWKIPEKFLNLISVVDSKQKYKNPIGQLYFPDFIVPESFIPENKRITWIVRALYNKKENYGLMVYELTTRNESVFESIQHTIASGLRTISLMERWKKARQKLRFAMQALEDSNKKLSRLDDMKNEFIANITHDFRSPLSIILNNADLSLKFDNVDPKIKSRLKVIFNASLKLKTSVDELLDLAKMDAKGIKLHVKPFNVKSYLADISEFYRSAIVSSNIKIIDILPAHEVVDFYTDPEKLDEIINNIMSNALKYIDPENGHIELELENNKDSIQIVISDNGVGIPHDKLNHIFGRFEQVEGDKNTQYKGTGIGLAFSKQLTEILKGKIRAESEGSGRGAKFILEFQKGLEHFNPDEVERSETPEKKGTSKLSMKEHMIKSGLEEKLEKKDIEVYISEVNQEKEYNTKKALILIVDDNQHIREIEKEYLLMAGYKNFILAQNGKQGIEAAYRYRPDLIICDYNMPLVRGDQFHDELMSNPDFKRIPFIFLTALVDKNIIAERKRKGAIAYLGKPIDQNDMLVTVEIHLSKYMEYKEAFQQSIMDELTQINNRRNFIRLLKDRLLERSYRHLSLIFIDIDHFKSFNDLYGHQTGDLVLSAMGRLIKKTLRSYDVSGRYGGEEFIAFLPDTDINQSYLVAEKLRQAVQQMDITSKGEKIAVTASFGIVSLLDNDADISRELAVDSVKELYDIKENKHIDWKWLEMMKLKIADVLIKFADEALYEAKSTKCLRCGFSNEKSVTFTDNSCPKCLSKDIIQGRNKVVRYTSESIKIKLLNL